MSATRSDVVVRAFPAKKRSRVIVIACSDSILYDELQKLYREHGIMAPFELKFTGGPLALIKRDELAIASMKLLVKKVTKVIIVAHNECAQYAADGYEFDTEEDEYFLHHKHLLQAREVVRELSPDILVQLFYLNGVSEEEVPESLMMAMG